MHKLRTLSLSVNVTVSDSLPGYNIMPFRLASMCMKRSSLLFNMVYDSCICAGEETIRAFHFPLRQHRPAARAVGSPAGSASGSILEA